MLATSDEQIKPLSQWVDSAGTGKGRHDTFTAQLAPESRQEEMVSGIEHSGTQHVKLDEESFSGPRKRRF